MFASLRSVYLTSFLISPASCLYFSADSAPASPSMRLSTYSSRSYSTSFLSARWQTPSVIAPSSPVPRCAPALYPLSLSRVNISRTRYQ